MKWVLVLLVAGCAAGHVNSNGSMHGIAIGHARLEHCAPVSEDQALRMCMALPVARTCTRIQGGTLSSNLTEALSSAFTVISTFLGAYFAFH